MFNINGNNGTISNARFLLGNSRFNDINQPRDME